MKTFALLIICLSLTACANTSGKRFEAYKDQVRENKRIDIVLDTFGVNDIKGELPGYDPKRNETFSKTIQEAVITSLSNKGYETSILSATMGVHTKDYIGDAQIVYADENSPTGQPWEGAVLPTEFSDWGDNRIINYFETAFEEAEHGNYKEQSKFVEAMNAPGNRELAAKQKQARSPEAAAQRKIVLQNMPDVLAASNADTILFVKLAGYEVHMGKAFGAALLSAGISSAASGGDGPITMTTFQSITPMSAVAIDKNTGQVMWTSKAQGTRYSYSHELVPTLFMRYPKAKK